MAACVRSRRLALLRQAGRRGEASARRRPGQSKGRRLRRRRRHHRHRLL